MIEFERQSYRVMDNMHTCAYDDDIVSHRQE